MAACLRRRRVPRARGVRPHVLARRRRRGAAGRRLPLERYKYLFGVSAVVLLLLDQEPAPAGVLLAPSRLPRRRRVGKVDVPLLVIGTPDDPEVPSDDVRRTAREQGVVPVWFPGLGHDLMLGAGQERVLETVLEWVGRAAPGGTGTR